LSSNPEILPVVRSALMSLTETLGFPAADCRAITRAVDEALANIIQHAYSGLPGRPIELLCRRILDRTSGKERAALEIVLQDQGVCADRKKLCSRSLDDVRPGGLGIHFIQESVDIMQYTRRFQRNRLRLVKYLPEAEPKPAITKGG
jgi:anti-sigma regulatory factor (Ser/Thr protein kinase)